MVLNRGRARRDDGAVIVMVALTLVALFGVSALVIDLGYARQESRHVQGSADAAALAGARELPIDGANAPDAAAAKSQAARYVNINMTNSDSAPPIVTCGSDVPPNATCYSVDDASVVVATPYTDVSLGAPPSFSLVYVRICEPTPTFVAGTMGASSPTVCREAVGRRWSPTLGHGMGLVVMDPTSCSALRFRGDSTTVLSSNGAVMVNSNCTNPTAGALDSSGSSWNLVADYIGVVGSATLSPCDPTLTTSCTATVPTEGIPPFDNPLDLSPPDPLPALSPDEPCAFSGTGPRVLRPGRYSTRCNFGGNIEYIFRPGTYYFEDGFQSGGNAVLACSNSESTYPFSAASSCDGVTFIAGANNISMSGSGEVYLPPPTAGDYAGVSIYQVSSVSSTINGTADFVLGTIYAPDTTLNFTGTGGGDPATSDKVNINGMVIGKNVDIAGSFYFNINVPEDAPETIPDDDFGLET